MSYSLPRLPLRGLIAAIAALFLALSACSSGDEGSSTAGSEGSTSAEEAGPTTLQDEGDDSADAPVEEDGGDEADENAEEPEEEADSEEGDSSENLPTKVVEAGTVKPEKSQSADAKKDALVTFKQSDSFAVVAEFECKECKGDIEIQQLGSAAPLDTGEKSLSGSYLLDLIGSEDEEQTLIVRADGKWKVKLSSWNDLPISSGTQEGKGSKVVYIGDTASAVEVSYKPPKDGGELTVDVISAVQKDGEQPKVKTISGTKKFKEKKDIKLPGVIKISGKGSWTVKPIS